MLASSGVGYSDAEDSPQKVQSRRGSTTVFGFGASSTDPDEMGAGTGGAKSVSPTSLLPSTPELPAATANRSGMQHYGATSETVGGVPPTSPSPSITLPPSPAMPAILSAARPLSIVSTVSGWQIGDICMLYSEEASLQHGRIMVRAEYSAQTPWPGVGWCAASGRWH